MKSLEIVLIVLGIITWVFFGGSLLISSIQSLIYDRNREKREIQREKRDLEYHNIRMKEFK